MLLITGSVRCCLVVTCWERADHLALVCDVKLCICHFSMCYLGSDVVLDCIDSWSLPLLLHCTKQYALSSILFYAFTWKYSSSTKSLISLNLFTFPLKIPIYFIWPLNLTYINYNTHRYLFWCQSFGDDSPYVCSLFFKFCLDCWGATLLEIAAHTIDHLFSVSFGPFVLFNHFSFWF